MEEVSSSGFNKYKEIDIPPTNLDRPVKNGGWKWLLLKLLNQTTVFGRID